ncbi:MAG: hypothetical protein IT168_30105 [Bryobacterales bacterium]|nr:hypothetical protein [Bryobacterales bacterium]
MGVLPNYKTVPDSSAPYAPIRSRQKLFIAFHDSFDMPMFGVAGVYAGIAQLSDQYPAWGQGLGGYARRYGAAMADQAIGNYMTEAILPIALHHDPRYFRLGQGSAFRRVTHAVSWVIVNRNDKGRLMFNAPEILGTAGTVGIASLYYPSADRNLHQMSVRFGTQVAFDAGSSALKEYWPDIRKKLFHK